MLPQKALHLYIEEEKKSPNINHNYIISEKLDGIYGYIDYINGSWGHIHSRHQRVIPAFIHARKEFEKLQPQTNNFRLIFEIYTEGLDFHTQNGIYNRSVGDCDAIEAKFYLHDMVYFNDLKVQAQERYDELYWADFKTDRILVHSVLAISDNKDEWYNYFNEVIEKGGEGIVLKRTDAPYQPDKKNSSLMKIKLEKSFDLLCTGWYKTIGEKGQVNYNLKLKRKSGVELDVRLGKHSDIDLLLADEKNFVGKVIEVKCMKEITKGGMLREGRFKAVRFDKTIKEID
jgi:ATP-dependent DNA ligase